MKTRTRLFWLPLLLASISASACAAPPLADITIIDRSTGERLPLYQHRGQLWVAGKPGNRYAIEVRNRTGERLLSVVSVDGVNVVSGETAAFDQRGYVLAPGSSTDIAGWRKSEQEVAAFLFTSLNDAYASRTGRPGNVGVIGIASFREYRPPVIMPAPAMNSAEADNRPASKAAAEASPPTAQARAADMSVSRLGTGHGERLNAPVQTVAFQRLNSRPDEIITIRYDSMPNLVAMGVIPSHYAWQQKTPKAFPADSYVPDPPRWN